jgi:hypothetical protein
VLSVKVGWKGAWFGFLIGTLAPEGFFEMNATGAYDAYHIRFGAA